METTYSTREKLSKRVTKGDRIIFYNILTDEQNICATKTICCKVVGIQINSEFMSRLEEQKV